jgi:ABC-type antimicrobial peptide transport system permease subunit
MYRRRTDWILVFILTAVILAASNPVPKVEAQAGSSMDYASIIRQVDVQAVMKHVSFFSGLGSRMTGYPGNEQAAEYIINTLKSLGLEVSVQRFEVPVPVDRGASITILQPEQLTIEAHPLYPNLAVPVATSAEGLLGRVVYVGSGNLTDFDGKEIQGSIVLMDFNSWRNWISAAKYGAAAVVFIAPDDTIFSEAETKYVSIPFKFPRLYVSASDGKTILGLLAKGAVTAKITANSGWEKRTAENIIAVLKGSTYPDQVIQLSSYYDSTSVVLSVAPGAQESIGTATLLEFAKYLTEHVPKSTVLFTFFSGHDQALAGSRKFVEEFGFGQNATFGSKIKVQINIDISTGTAEIGPFWSGGLSGLGGGMVPSLKAGTLMNDFVEQAKVMSTQLNKAYLFSEDGLGGLPDEWGRISPMRIFPNDHEPTIYAQGAAFTLMTGDVRRYFNTPLDTIEHVDIANLQPQVELVYGLLDYAANLDDLVPGHVTSWHYNVVRDINAWMGWTWLTGKIAFFDYSTGWYTPIPNATVFVRYAYSATLTGSKVFGIQYGSLLYSGATTWMMDITDKDGAFNMTGINYNYQFNLVSISAYSVNKEGDLVYAPDYGIRKYAETLFPPADIHTDIGIFALFKCSTMVLVDAFDPDLLQVPRDFTLNVLMDDFRTHAVPDAWGESVDEHDSGVSMSLVALYLPPDTPVEIFARTSYAQRYPLFLLTNSTRSNLGGTGYSLGAGQQLIVDTPRESAQSMFWLDEGRLSEIGRYRIETPALQQQEGASSLLGSLTNALSTHAYSKVNDYANSLWTDERQVYLGARTVIEDAVFTIPIIALFLLIFAFFAEQLLFTGAGWRRLLYIIVIVVLGFVALFLNHPGYALSSDILLIIIGISMLFLIAPIVAIVIQSFFESARYYMVTLLGRHRISVERIGAIGQSFTVGVRNIRRHRTQSILALLTITPVVISLVSLTSISTTPALAAATYSHTSPYIGVQLEQEAYGNAWYGFTMQALQDIQVTYAGTATVAPRAWMYMPAAPGAMPVTITGAGGAQATVIGLVGLTPQETIITNADQTLVKGRWFSEADRYAMILPENVAGDLGIKDLPANVSLSGIDFQVIGIVSVSKFNEIKDIDGGELAPTNIVMGPGSREHFSIDNFAIVGFDDLIHMGGRIITISLRMNKPEAADVESVGKQLFGKFHAYTYVGTESGVYLYSGGTTFALVGAGTQLFPVAISALILMNLMLGIVNSRAREISTFSTIGMNPRQVSVMFFSQAVIYAMVGSVLGYLLSLFIITYLAPTGLAVNYSSVWVLLAVGIAMATTVASTIYPMLVSSRLVTPSLERRWTVPTKPAGDDWTVPFPFVVTTENETIGMMNFMKEFLQQHVGQTAEFFIVSDLRYEKLVAETEQGHSLKMTMGLPPYELGMRQEATLKATLDATAQRYGFEVSVHRLSGSSESWRTTNRYVFDELRKQLLLWRTMSQADKDAYAARTFAE